VECGGGGGGDGSWELALMGYDVVREDYAVVIWSMQQGELPGWPHGRHGDAELHAARRATRRLARARATDERNRLEKSRRLLAGN
jgi:hypothetical protein